MEVKGTVIKSEKNPDSNSGLILTIQFWGENQPQRDTEDDGDKAQRFSAISAMNKVAAEFPPGCTIKLMEKE